MKNLAHKTILITGGASGIGKIMARLMLERGGDVILWDINPVALKATVAELSPLGEVTAYQVDVSDAEQIARAAAGVTKLFGGVDVIVNNAGIVVGKHFGDHSTADISKTIDINTTAPMLITRAFLPGMVARDSGHVCNVASSAGLIANPRMSVYAASKWALVGWSESLRMDLQQSSRQVKVTSVLPYYINTGMFDGVKSRLPILDPEEASLAIVRAIERDAKLVTLPGYIYRFTRISQGLLPDRVFDWMAGRVLGIYTTMEGFVGRA